MKTARNKRWMLFVVVVVVVQLFKDCVAAAAAAATRTTCCCCFCCSRYHVGWRHYCTAVPGRLLAVLLQQQQRGCPFQPKKPAAHTVVVYSSTVIVQSAY
jgi:hypothetical protein